MPKATDGGFPSHLFRINVNPSYSTFPTPDEFLGNTKKVANTAPDGSDPLAGVAVSLLAGGLPAAMLAADAPTVRYNSQPTGVGENV